MTGRAVAPPGSAVLIARSLWLASLAFLVVFLGYGLVSPGREAPTAQRRGADLAASQPVSTMRSCTRPRRQR